MCFIAAQPQAVEPLGANRGPIFFYISAWPKDGVKTEPSIKVGYPVKPDAEMSVTVGTDTFKLFIKGERGFVSDPTEELKLVEALKKGSNAFVKATSARGTATTDTYSLSGLSTALDKLAADLPSNRLSRPGRGRRACAGARRARPRRRGGWQPS